MYSRFFHFPPYNRFAPWREDSEYRVAVVSPVGMGPKGDKGDPLTYSDLTDDDKLDLADVLLNKGLEKGDQGDPGLSAYDLAGGDEVWGNIDNWFASFDRFPNLSPEDEETWKEWLLSTIPEGAIEDAVADAIDDKLEDIAEDLKDEVIDDIVGVIYPVGSLYFTMVDLGETGPNILGFPGNWVQIQDRFLYASTGEAGVEGGATNGNITLTVGQLPAHTHSLNNGTNTPKFVHNHNLGGDALVRPTGGLYSTSGKTRQRYVYNKTQNKLDPITSFTRQSTISAEGTHYDGRAMIFNSNRLTSDSIAAGKATPNYVETGPVKNNSWTGSLATTGSGDQVNIMPPYITVHVWQRMPDPVTSESQESDGESGNDGEANYGTIWEGEN